ncbi:hypothetical protein [Micromonospora carbonacea]|uniref:Uncharacterized protein n=1 Tax=Micromonospora carbonacea TaxID=47853 RepID=A0A1C4WYM7_9ACTN|nr:hypothetical protein [Micromonospora carbonacea]SCF01290.1 hypothetical protein GA0070563_104114 [Micromonospora carbonacea]
MIRINGRRYGTRRELTAHFGPDVTTDMIRNWARSDREVRCPQCARLDLTTTDRPCTHPLRLTTITAGGRAYHPLDEATDIEAVIYLNARGRPRRLDDHGSTAA